MSNLASISEPPVRCFFGRLAEASLAAQLMLNRYHDRWNNQSYNHAKTLLVTGAPGAGKTALQHEVARLWQAAGVAVVRLLASDFQSTDSLIAAFARQGLAEKSRAARAKSVRANLSAWTEQAEQSTDLTPPMSDNLVPFTSDIRIPAPNTRKADRLAKRLCEAPSSESPIRIIGRFDDLFPRGWVIMVDDAHQLIDCTSNWATTTILHDLSVPDRRLRLNLKYGNLWLTGRTSCIHALKQHGVQHFQHVKLGGLSVTAATQIIERHISANANAETAEQLIAEWVPPLAKKYHVWAHHTVGAAASAGWMAKHKPHSTNALDLIMARAEQYCEKLYDGRLLDLMEIELETEAYMTVRATQICEGGVKAATLRSLIDQLRRQTYRQAEPKVATANVIDALVHTGVIERQLGGVVVPIPSLGNHMLRRTGELAGVEKILRNAKLLNRPSCKPATKRRTDANKKS